MNGPLMGSPQCRMSVLRNVPCNCFIAISKSILKGSNMLHVKLRIPNFVSIICMLLSLGSMSHIDLKEQSCRYVSFKGQEPHEKGL